MEMTLIHDSIARSGFKYRHANIQLNERRTARSLAFPPRPGKGADGFFPAGGGIAGAVAFILSGMVDTVGARDGR
jgi:hypothetical protein